MTWKNILFIVLIMGPFFASGCSYQNYELQDSELQKYWGRSYESAKYNQIINPFPVNTDPIVELDGESAVYVMENYKKSFKEAQQETLRPSRSILGSIIE